MLKYFLAQDYRFANILFYINFQYRYVGVENAKAIEESGLCLEEYIYQQMNQK